MTRRTMTRSAAALAIAATVAVAWLMPRGPALADRPAIALPAPAADPAPAQPGLQTAIFAGGCFWGVQGVFQHVRGVTEAVSGYAGGTVANPGYDQVSTGSTGHAESVRVTFDPSRVSFGTLLQVFFSVALDPTEVNRQGPDSGTQYRSDVFVTSAGQKQMATAYLAQLVAAHAFDRPIATRIEPAGAFYPAEGYHQDYLTRHPNNPYIAIKDMPKLRNLQLLFPAVWQDSPVLVNKAVAGG